jgi:uncharacterized protein (TIGR02145 family)
MKNFFTLTLCFLTLSLTAQETGCTYSIANNYSSTAIVDDGTCVFGGVNVFDYDNDGNIAINDFIAMLSYFGDTDSDSDGVFDSEDDCLDLEACNYSANPSEPCVYFIDALGICGGNCLSDINDDGFCDEFNSCGDLVAHEGYNYSTVLIGEQCWFSENCRYLPSVSPSSEGSETNNYYYVYGYEGTDVEVAKLQSNYETYGVLYNWPAVNSGGICPSGWHVPSDGEWTQLVDFLGGESVAGVAMKSTSGWNEYNGSSGGTNSSGFTGLPGGIYSIGLFHSNGAYGYFWTGSLNGYITGGNGSWWTSWSRRLGWSGSDAFRNFSFNDSGFSARCIQD